MIMVGVTATMPIAIDQAIDFAIAEGWSFNG
jgi:hypothetical protein